MLYLKNVRVIDGAQTKCWLLGFRFARWANRRFAGRFSGSLQIALSQPSRVLRRKHLKVTCFKISWTGKLLLKKAVSGLVSGRVVRTALNFRWMSHILARFQRPFFILLRNSRPSQNSLRSHSINDKWSTPSFLTFIFPMPMISTLPWKSLLWAWMNKAWKGHP